MNLGTDHPDSQECAESCAYPRRMIEPLSDSEDRTLSDESSEGDDEYPVSKEPESQPRAERRGPAREEMEINGVDSINEMLSATTMHRHSENSPSSDTVTARVHSNSDTPTQDSIVERERAALRRDCLH
jgi:hypothetical protein